VVVNAQQDKAKGEENRQISKTVLEHVLVLAVAQEAGRDDTKPKVVSAVTLELSLEDSERLDLARSVGTLSLVLRNQVDKDKVQTAGITKSQLFGEKQILPVSLTAPAAAAPKPRVFTGKPSSLPAVECVEVIQNSSRALTCF
jgi:pilus assembly protein CpaB